MCVLYAVGTVDEKLDAEFGVVDFVGFALEGAAVEMFDGFVVEFVVDVFLGGWCVELDDVAEAVGVFLAFELMMELNETEFGVAELWSRQVKFAIYFCFKIMINCDGFFRI